MNAKVTYHLIDDPNGPSEVFALSHGRTVEISEPLGDVDLMVVLAQGLMALSPDRATTGEGIIRFARVLKCGGLEGFLDNAFPETPNLAVIVHVIDVVCPDESARITLRFQRGGSKGDAWCALAECIALVAASMHHDPVAVLTFLASHLPDGTVAYSGIDPHPEDTPKPAPSPEGWAVPGPTYRSRGGDA